MAKKSRTYILQFVIGLDFFSGLWTVIGIDPQAVILNVLGNVVLPTILLLLSILGAYTKGRLPGLISVIVAYLAGVAILIGYMAAGRRLTKKLVGI